MSFVGGAAPERASAFDAPGVACGDALDGYDRWPQPSAIVSDGAYGVGGFPGDPRTPAHLLDWYRPHVEAWSQRASPATTLWFWNTEVGWASIHPLLHERGWEYVQAVVWDKGLGHIAGNVNGETIRRFPVVTEICVLYRRRLEFATPQGAMPAKAWLRFEWRRAGLVLREANAACGVKNAGTRKYLTQDWLWYFPPPEMMRLLVAYANERGAASGRPYFSLDGKRPVTPAEWSALRPFWSHENALTNVWSQPPLAGDERYKGDDRRSVHLNQKPLVFMRRILRASTRPGDVVWEPFGGLCSASVAAIELDRKPFAAERDRAFHELAQSRLERTVLARAAKGSPDIETDIERRDTMR